jgi:D-3-phosphoglycerate dehydrogenase / 2-oxoglutarate reductase
MKPLITINTSSFVEQDSQLISHVRDHGFEIRFNPHGRQLTPAETVDLCRDSVAVVAGTEKFGAEVIAACRHLKVISRCGAGMDNVDRTAAQTAGIRVFNTPDAPVNPVAELTLAMILGLLRKVNVMDAALRQGRWNKQMGNLLSARRVGIIGFGRIGRKVGQLLAPFGCELAFADPAVADGTEGVCRRDLHDLLQWADLISVHASTGEQILGAAELDMLAPGAWLVNVSRGSAVDEGALAERLIAGRLAGAALDVFAKEPYTGPLATLDTVLLTPHVGSYAQEARSAMERESILNLLSGLEISL